MSPALRLVFFGTPEFAVPALAALVAAELAPALVVSQPDRPSGRGRERRSPAVARWALAHGLPLQQVERVRDPGFQATLADLAPDLAVVVAFGQIFPPELLALPRLGCLNLHASLLPRWRGAAPIQAAIAAGDRETGVCAMQMEAGLDTGPVFGERRLPIGDRETAGELSARLAAVGAELLVETVRALAAGPLVPRPQSADGVSVAPKLRREQERVDWKRPARELDRLLRAATPGPGLVAELRGAPLRLVRAEPVSGSPPPGREVGAYLGLVGAMAAVAAGGDSILGLAEVQRPGRRVVTGRDLVNGERLTPGDRFG